MSYEDVVMIWKDAIITILTASAPMLAGALITGFIVAIFQATTQINEQTMAFVPKIVCVFALLVFLGSWILGVVNDFTIRLYENILRIIL